MTAAHDGRDARGRAAPGAAAETTRTPIAALSFTLRQVTAERDALRLDRDRLRAALEDIVGEHDFDSHETESLQSARAALAQSDKGE